MSDYPDFVGGETAAVTGALNDMKHALNGIGGDGLESGDIYQGATTQGTDAPYLRSKDSGASGIDFRWLNDAGVVALQLNTGTEGSPVWVTCFTFDLTSRKLTVGDSTSTTKAALHVVDGGSDNNPGLLVLYDDAGADYYFWMDTAGNLRFHTSAPADDDTDGYIVATAGAATVSTAHDHVGGDGAQIDHAGTANLTTGDPHTQYGLLAGRSGGQTLVGGTGTTDDLILQATSGNGTTGSLIVMKVGNNGAVDAVTVNHLGRVGIGLSPTANMAGLSVEAGVLTLKETTTPTADSNYGKIYTKSDNFLYFQDGDGAEHTLLETGGQMAGMYMYEAAFAMPIDTTQKYHLCRGFGAGTLSGWTFSAGKTGPIASFADYGGTVPGTVRANDVGHGLVTGDIVSITGATSAGHNKVASVTKIDNDSFYYTATWGADSTGTWNEGSYLQAGANSAGTYLLSFTMSCSVDVASKQVHFEIFKNASEQNNISAEMTPGSTAVQNCSAMGFISIAAGDRIFLGVENYTDATDLTFQHANVVLRRM